MITAAAMITFNYRWDIIELLAEAMKKPTVRAETVLDGIFAKAVAIIEADGDRIVYQAAWEVVGKDRSFDIHFAAVGGTGGISDTCQLYKTLGIPVAVISDLDLITDFPKIKLALRSLCDEEDRVKALLEEVQNVSQLLRELPPTIDAETVRSKLNEILASELNWSKGHDREVRSSLSNIRNELNGMRGLKSGGISELPTEIADRLGQLVEDLSYVGLFLVPVGELEYWLSRAEIKISKKKKWAWANAAADYLRASPEQEGDIWKFMQDIGQYLTDQLNALNPIQLNRR